MMTRLRIKLAVFTSILTASITISPAWLQAQENGPASVPNEVLVQFRVDASSAHLANALNRAGLTVRKHLKAGTEESGLVLASTTLPNAHAIQALANHPAVEFAEPNWIYTHQSTANDPYYTGGSLWGMYGDATSPRNLYGSQAGEAWAAGNTGSDTVYVGIIDEGIDSSHPDLAQNLGTNPGETGYYNLVNADDGSITLENRATNKKDDDGNGYIDDVNGWDFVHNDETIYDAADGDDHGTHVTGTIAAAGNNSMGVVGVNWRVQYLSGKFLGPNGGTLANAVLAVKYFTDLKTRTANPVNIVALNNSWGGGGYSVALHETIIRAAKADILFIAAAGNNGWNNDIFATYPANYNTTVGTANESAASYDSVIAVAAIDSSGRKASFSNYGKTRVELGAPGVGIWSTVPGGYASYSGTSMATPHVTGGAALYAASHPAAPGSVIPGSEIRTAIISSIVYTKSLNGKTSTNGRLNVSGF